METKYLEVYCKSFLPTNRWGTLKTLLLHTTPRLKEPGKARRKSPSAITEPKPSQLRSSLRPVLEKPSLLPPHSPWPD